jgi:capsular polysaccharide biosynthesis protein
MTTAAPGDSRALLTSSVRDRLIKIIQWSTAQPRSRALYKYLPLTSRQIGPPRGEMSHADYAQRYGAELTQFDDGERHDRDRPFYIGQDRDVFLDRVVSRLPANSVLTVRGARMVGPHGWIIGRGDFFLLDASWYRDDSTDCGVYKLVRVRPGRRIEGRTLSLASDWASGNYVHFLLDALPRLALFEQAGFTTEETDHVIVPDLPSRTGQEVLEVLRIPKTKVIPLSTLGTVEFEELLLTTYPGIRRNVSRRQASFVRERLTLGSDRHGRRLYVSRGPRARRCIANEADIIHVLERIGFEIYTPGRGIDDLRVFSEAAVVVGAHGAALANIAACHPGTVIIELLPDGFLYPYFYTLASSAGCSYACLVSERGQKNPRTDNFPVDVRKFERLLDEVLGSDRIA